jgi:hypothetical protein
LELSELRDLSRQLNEKQKQEFEGRTLFAELIADIRYAVVRGVWVLGNLSSLPTGREGPEIDFYIRDSGRKKQKKQEFASPGAIKILISQVVAQQRGGR